MATEIITKEDLRAFRLELLNDLLKVFKEQKSGEINGWLKNREVCQLLQISRATLQRLRIAGKIKSSKIGGSHYYRFSDIEGFMNSHFK